MSDIIPYDPGSVTKRGNDKTLFPLPSLSDDGSRLCVRVNIPNIPAHRQAFIGAIYNLTRWYSWSRDEAHTGKVIAAVWRDVFLDMMAHFYDGCEDCPPEPSCRDYPTDSGVLSYFPTNPFTEPENIPNQFYNKPPFYLLHGDVLTDITVPSANPLDLPYLAETELPRIRVTVNGDKLVRLYLLSIIQGGYASIVVDDNPLTANWVDLTRASLLDFQALLNAIQEGLGIGDLNGILVEDVIVEVKLETVEEHHIDIIFWPKFNTEVIVGFGGGLRKVEICGNEICDDMSYFELRQNPDDSCLLEQRLESDGDWLPAFDYGLCNPPHITNITRQITNVQNVQNTIINNQRTEVYDGTPGSINDDAPSDNFNGDASTERDTALCMAVRYYVEQYMQNAVNNAALATGTAIAATVVGALFTPWAAVGGGLAVLATGITYGALVSAIGDRAALNAVICDLYDSMKGTAISEANFASKINALTGSNTHETTIVDNLKAGSGQRANYLKFIDLLGSAYPQAEAGADDCPCGDEICTPLGWFSGVWYMDTKYERGTVVGEPTDDYIILESRDRGDGQQVIEFSVNDRTSCCNVRWEFVGTPPNGALKFYNLCPAQADVETLTQNDLMGQCNNVTSYLFQMDPGGPWQIKFTFVDDCS